MEDRVARVQALVAWVLLIGAYGALAGCSATSAKPAPLPTEVTASSPSGSPSPSPSVSVAPTLPAEARGTGPKGAKAFAQHYVDSVNFAMSSGHTKALRALSKRSCGTCNAIADRVEGIYSRGGYLKGRGWVVEGITYARGRQDDVVLVSVALTIPAQTIKSSASSHPKVAKGTQGNLDLHMRRGFSGWVIQAMEAS